MKRKVHPPYELQISKLCVVLYFTVDCGIRDFLYAVPTDLRWLWRNLPHQYVSKLFLIDLDFLFINVIVSLNFV